MISTRSSFFIPFTCLLLLLHPSLTAQEKSWVPSWVQDAVIYHIFPERFANGDARNDPPDVQPWGGQPTYTNYFGGDLRGILDHLDYLQQLGINALYLNPIFESSTNHKYHTKDYRMIDDNFGDEVLFRAFVEECHRRGIRVILDAVFNHTGVDFFAFEDVKKYGNQSPYVSWYNFHGFPVGPPDKPNYEAWWGIGDLPKLMVNNPDVEKHLFDVTEHWMRCGIDGWRLDVPNEMPHEFWIAWRKLVKSINPDAYIVGEIWDDASPWLQGDQFDAVMNYRFRGACVGYIALENRTVTQFDSILVRLRTDHPDFVTRAMQNLISSHDVERYLTLCDNDVDKMKLTVLFQMTNIGAPMVYYGDEIGMRGGKDPDNRRTMIWDTTQWNRDLLDWYRGLIALRNRHPVFRRGSYETLMADSASNVYAFLRRYNDEHAIVMLNNSGQSREATLAIPDEVRRDQWMTIWPDEPHGDSIRNGVLTMRLPARGGVILMGTERR